MQKELIRTILLYILEFHKLCVYTTLGEKLIVLTLLDNTTFVDYEDAVSDFSQLIQLAPMSAAAYELRAGAYAALGKETEAAEDRKKAETFGAAATDAEEPAEDVKINDLADLEKLDSQQAPHDGDCRCGHCSGGGNGASPSESSK